MNTYRLFIAAELPLEVKQALAAAQERLRRGDLPVKWVAPESMHLTLRFLGDTDAELLPQLSAALRAAMSDGSAPPEPIVLHLTTAGAFPNMSRPHVVWAGVGGATAALGRCQAAISKAIDALGFSPETYPFRAHLTLGRVRREATPSEQERLGNAIRSLSPFAPTPWPVERIVLFRSELSRSGPVYTALDAVKR